MIKLSKINVQQIISKIILYFIGWTLVQGTEDRIEEYFSSKKTRSMVWITLHTSAWDAFIGVLVSWRLKLNCVYAINEEWTKIPLLGNIILYLGFIPLYKNKPSSSSSSSNQKGFVDQMSNYLINNTDKSFAIMPEGSRFLRDKNNAWKTGFYHIAKQANVPIGFFGLDFGKQKICFMHSYIYTPGGSTGYMSDLPVSEIIQYFWSIAKEYQCYHVDQSVPRFNPLESPLSTKKCIHTSRIFNPFNTWLSMFKYLF